MVALNIDSACVNSYKAGLHKYRHWQIYSDLCEQRKWVSWRVFEDHAVPTLT